MKIELVVKQDDYTFRTVFLAKLWKLLKGYLSQNCTLWILVKHNDPTKGDTEIRVWKH